MEAVKQNGDAPKSKFLVRRELGSGGMGTVFVAEHRITKRVGALKVLDSRHAGSREVVERFLREASAAARIGSPHIVETIDAGVGEQGAPYMFMELLAGDSLREVLESTGRLPLERALELSLQTAEGLGAAHAKGVVHRDVKPENLFVCRGERPFVKILDFGISKFSETDGELRLTAEGAILGTPYYMSPEQVLGSRDIDARTDIYSLGVVLYECVTGRVPFLAETLASLSVQFVEGKYPRASELVPELPDGFDELVASAMATQRDQRYPDMLAFRRALEEALTRIRSSLPHATTIETPRRRNADGAPRAPSTPESPVLEAP